MEGRGLSMTPKDHSIFWEGLPESSPEARLLFLEETFQTINRLGSEAFLILSPELKIIWANERAASLTGHPLNRLINQEIISLFPPPDRGIIRDLLQSQILRSELKISSEVKIITALFEIREVEISMVSCQTRLDGKRIYMVMKDITVSKSIETRFLDVHKALQKIIEMGNDGILVFDQDYRIEFANSLASKITGFPKDRLIGLDFRTLLSPQDREFLLDLPTQMRLQPDENRKVCTEFNIITRSLEQREVEICLTLAPLEGTLKIYAYLRDLSERIRIENEMRKTNNFLKNIIISSVDGIIAADMKGKIIIFNQGAERMLGYPAHEVINGGLHITQIYIPGQAKEIMKKLRSPDFSRVGKLSSTLVSLVTKNQETLPASLSASIIYDEEGQEMASVGIFTDLRERFRMQKELEETHLKLLHAEKMASLGKLAAGVAHEINNPLGGILIYANVLFEETSPEDPRRADLKQIVDQTMRCKEIVKELLDFSRQTTHCWVQCDINQALQQTVSLLGKQALFHDIQIIKEIDPHLPQIIADPGQLNQVLINLMTNAVDAMEGKGVLTMRTYFLPDEERIGLEIADTGYGIHSENLSRIFDPFFTTKDIGKGTGLGLSTVYGIVEEHGGTIEVESTVGQGTTFILRLPVRRPALERSKGEE
jgi:two-component system, NtrC family, sensor kinase